MKSINFEFLRPRWPELASLGGFAEAYAHNDPVAAVGKLRQFCEQVALFVRLELRLPKLVRPALVDLLNDAAFRAAVPEVIAAKLHLLRTEGNKAVHGNEADTSAALRLLKDAFDLGRWLAINFAERQLEDLPEFVETPIGGVEGLQRRREKKAIFERIAAQEAQMQKLLAEVEEARARAAMVESTPVEREQALAAGQQSALALMQIDPLSFDEAATRQRLIDVALAEAGWQVGPQSSAAEQVGREIEVPGQPTDSGLGYADYVLFDDNGLPLAVIEAKKTATSAEAGRTQAQLYANGLEQKHGQRPVIFYTNGHDTWIWNDAVGEPPRKIFGFYSKDSLQHLLFQRAERRPLRQVELSGVIAGRMYQLEAVKRVLEKFSEKKRKALIVQATGTGKTRVAISLCEALMRARWAKRVLFLCDRRELRKQANNAFKEYLPDEPRTNVTAQTAHDRNQRVYLATYPAMMQCYANFDVGFFDLIIADESHRSLYNRYRELFEYFDSFQVGLTATPVKFVARDTFRMFDCEATDPTANFSYEEAISHDPPYLATFTVESHTTPFLRDGIKYSQMTAEQRQQLEEDETLPQLIEYEQAEVDKRVFNRDTNRQILRNLMERGLRVADGTRLGKTIVFARNHNHALLLQNLFDELYPQYGGEFCRVIDNYDPRAEELIDEFKRNDKAPGLTIAISVDMLDTGIDVPEILNLVFAKPVYSYVKFWQMIGRGTRLCQNLFGPGQHKTQFQIFDHWGNFDRFGEDYRAPEPSQAKPLMQRLFESRLALADVALAQQQPDALDLACRLLRADVAALPAKTIAVRERWKSIRLVQRDGALESFAPAIRATLAQELAPLMQWVPVAGHEAAHKFDRLIAELQIARLKGSAAFADLQDDLVNQVLTLPINLSQVRDRLPAIERAKQAQFWQTAGVAELEQLRVDLRGVMQFQRASSGPALPPKVIDVVEDDLLVERKRPRVPLAGLDMAAYRQRVHKALDDIVQSNPTLQKIKAGRPVNQQDLDDLCSLVLTQEPGLDLRDLADYYPESAGHLDRAIRGIIGLDAHAVDARFARFVREHPTLASHQIRFLDLLQNHITRYGSIELERLYEPPFTHIHGAGPDGLFDQPAVAELFDIVRSFQPPAPADATDNQDTTAP